MPNNNNNIAIAKLYNNIGIFLHNEGKIKESINYLFKAKAEAEGMIQKNYCFMGTICKNLAMSFLLEGNSLGSHEYLLMSKSYFELMPAYNNDLLASVYNDIAATYFCENYYQEAALFLFKCKRI